MKCERFRKPRSSFWLALWLFGSAGFVQAQTLADALDTTNLTWATWGIGDASGWSTEPTLSHDGISAAGSGPLYYGYEASTLQTTVTGPGTLTFWWCNQTTGDGVLALKVNGEELAELWGGGYPPIRWEQQSLYLPAGEVLLEWCYTNSWLPTSGESYLDEVAYTPGAASPVITNQPVSQSQVPGCKSAFTVGATGTPPLYYQWHFNGDVVDGATSSELKITNASATALGIYSVSVSNSAGVLLSSNATLEFGQVTVWPNGSGRGVSATPPGATNLLALAAGSIGLGLRPDGTLLAWGGTEGAVSNASTVTNAVAITARFGNYLALRADGTVTAWGHTNVPANLTNAVAVSCGLNHATALTSDGRVVAWGLSSGGRTNVPSGLSNVVAIVAGFDDNLALRADGTVVAWSSGAMTDRGLSNIVAIAENSSPGRYCFALRDDGTVIGWDDSYAGEPLPPLGLTNVVAIDAGSPYNVMALKADGTVAAWADPTRMLTPTNLPAAFTNVIAIAAGSYSYAALVGSGPPITRAAMQNPNVSAAGFTVTIPSQSGRVYALEFKNSPDDPSWTHLPLVAGTGKNLTLRDPDPGISHRIYRVRRW